MRILDNILQAIAPHNCIGCNSEGSLLCELCSLQIKEVPARCYKCLRYSKESRTCNTCRKASKLGHVWVTTEYEGIAEDLIKAFKFSRAYAAHKIIAQEMLTNIPYLPGHIVCYVPTSPARTRARGYDQAKLIANTIAREKKMTATPLLSRTGSSRQVGANKHQRQEQAKFMFRYAHKQSLKGQHILLVDDIVTTGATLEAAAELLKQNGAKTVDAVVFAQKTVKS